MVKDSAVLLRLAKAGDSEAFGLLTQPYQGELLAHCYRMLGSLPDAEDARQETLVAAWQSLAGFEERASLRTWLYRIATNRSLNLRRSATRRSRTEAVAASFPMPDHSRVGEVLWLTPLPDHDIDQLPEPGPEARYETKESISLAFITALQQLPPRQLSVLVLRDVLGFTAAEVAAMLATTVQSVHSALKRARLNLDHTRSANSPGHRPDSAAEAELLERFVTAFDSRDLDGLVALFTDDAFVSMPPLPLEYVGPEAIRRFYVAFFAAGRSTTLIPTRANRQPAYGFYARGADGVDHGIGVLVLALSGDRISALTRFEPALMAPFGLPRSLA